MPIRVGIKRRLKLTYKKGKSFYKGCTTYFRKEKDDWIGHSEIDPVPFIKRLIEYDHDAEGIHLSTNFKAIIINQHFKSLVRYQKMSDSFQILNTLNQSGYLQELMHARKEKDLEQKIAILKHENQCLSKALEESRDKMIMDEEVNQNNQHGMDLQNKLEEPVNTDLHGKLNSSLGGDAFVNEDLAATCLSCPAKELIALKMLQKEADQKDEQIAELTLQVIALKEDLEAAREEKLVLEELLNTNNFVKDEIIKRAWDVSGQAISRNKHLEDELRKTRKEVNLLNDQLNKQQLEDLDQA